MLGPSPPPGVKGYAPPSCPPPTTTVPPCRQTTTPAASQRTTPAASKGYPQPQRTTPAASKGYPQPQRTTPAASKGYPQPQRTTTPASKGYPQPQRITPAATKGYPQGGRGHSSVEGGRMRLYQGLQSRHGDTAQTRYSAPSSFESSYSAPSRSHSQEQFIESLIIFIITCTGDNGQISSLTNPMASIHVDQSNESSKA